MRILIMEALAKTFETFCGHSIEGVLAFGNEVHVCAPVLMQDCTPCDWLESRGVLCYNVPQARTGASVAEDLQALPHLYRLMQKICADRVLACQS